MKFYILLSQTVEICNTKEYNLALNYFQEGVAYCGAVSIIKLCHACWLHSEKLYTQNDGTSFSNISNLKKYCLNSLKHFYSPQQQRASYFLIKIHNITS